MSKKASPHASPGHLQMTQSMEHTTEAGYFTVKLCFCCIICVHLQELEFFNPVSDTCHSKYPSCDSVSVKSELESPRFYTFYSSRIIV